MKRSIAVMLATTVLAACAIDGGNPLEVPEEETTTDTGTDTTTDTTTDTGAPISSPAELPPGTANPTPDASIFRSEPTSTDAAAFGNGYANSVSYDAATDTFFVDGLAFDGDQPNGAPFTRSNPGSLGTFALYESPAFVPDSLTGTPIEQNEHRAIYGVSQTGNTEFAIVRTGSYIEYGFGGFVYQRNGGVVLPTDGQATYSGDYAGLRDFDGLAEMQITTGDALINVDFRAFRGNCAGTTCADAIWGAITNRQVFATDGSDITLNEIQAAGDVNNTVLAELPVLQLRIGPGVASPNGEASGTAFSAIGGDVWEEGNYYAVLAGDHTASPGGEIVGVIVVEAPYAPQITVRETGGFIANRQ